MNETTRIPEAILWHEGQLLTPQHFQEWSDRTEALIAFHLGLVSPWHWGVQHLEIDQASLAVGMYRVLALDAVMPDGLVVSFRDQGESSLQIDLNEFSEELKAADHPIYLAVALNRGAVVRDEELRRYRSVEGLPVSDRHSGGGEVRIPRIQPLLSLHFERPSQLFASFPLARVSLQNQVLSPSRFVPATAAVVRESILAKVGRDLVGSMRRKAVHLASQLATSVNLDPLELMARRQHLYYVTAGLPQLEASLAVDGLHPFQLFQSLSQVAGHVAALGENRLPPQFDPYDHQDPLTSLERLITYINDILDQRVAESYLSATFSRERDYYVLPFKKEWLSRPLVLGFHKGALFTDRGAHTWVEQSIVAPEGEVQHLRELRILGWGRKHAKRISGLAVSDGVLLFQLEIDDFPIAAEERLIVSPVVRSGETIMPESIELFIKN